MRHNFKLRSSKQHFWWRATLYLLLIASGALTLLARPYIIQLIRSGEADALWILIGPLSFALLLVVFTVDNFMRQRQGPTKSGSSLIMPIFGILLLAILLPGSLREYKARNTPELSSFEFVESFLRYRDARVRALLMVSSSCIVPDPEKWRSLIDQGLKDPDPMVRQAAERALSNRLGIEIREHKNNDNDEKNVLKFWNHSKLVSKSKK